jgi:hypothetical protein
LEPGTSGDHLGTIWGPSGDHHSKKLSKKTPISYYWGPSFEEKLSKKFFGAGDLWGPSGDHPEATHRKTKQCKTEQSKANQSNEKQSKAGQSNAKQCKAM